MADNLDPDRILKTFKTEVTSVVGEMKKQISSLGDDLLATFGSKFTDKAKTSLRTVGALFANTFSKATGRSTGASGGAGFPTAATPQFSTKQAAAAKAANMPSAGGYNKPADPKVSANHAPVGESNKSAKFSQTVAVAKAAFSAPTSAPTISASTGGGGGSSGGGGGGGFVAKADRFAEGMGGWGAVGAATGSVAKSTWAAMPDAMAGIRRKDDAHFASVIATGGSSMADSNRNTTRGVLGERFSDVNSDMDVLHVGVQNHMASTARDQANLAQSAGYGFQAYGLSNEEAAQQSMEIWKPDQANMLYSQYGVSTTDAKGVRRTEEDISKDLYQAMKSRNPGMTSEALMTQLQAYGDNSPLAESLTRNIVGQIDADKKGVEWSQKEGSEWAKSQGMDKTSSAKYGKLQSAQTDRIDRGADASAAGFSAAADAATKLEKAFLGLYNAVGPLADLLQAGKGAEALYQGDEQGTLKKGWGVAKSMWGLGKKVLGGMSEGTMNVPRDGTANLHAGEIVLPNRIARSVRDTLSQDRPWSKRSGPLLAPVASVELFKQYGDRDRKFNPQAAWLNQPSPFGRDEAARRQFKAFGDKGKDDLQKYKYGPMAGHIDENSPAGALRKFQREILGPKALGGAAEKLIGAAKSLVGAGDKQKDAADTQKKALKSSETKSKSLIDKVLSASGAKSAASAVSSAGSRASKALAPIGSAAQSILTGSPLSAAKTMGGAIGGAAMASPLGAPAKAAGNVAKSALGVVSSAASKVLGGLTGLAKAAFTIPKAAVNAVVGAGADVLGAATRLPLFGLSKAVKAATGGGGGGTPAPGDTSSPSYDPSGGVAQWKDLVIKVLKDLGLSESYLPGILKQIQQESSGDPNASNGWDSNAQQGIASFGLLQTIASTYQTYAPPGKAGTIIKKDIGSQYGLQDFVPEQLDPYNNIYAALNYVKSTYGEDKFLAWNAGQNQGYSQGAWSVTKDQVANIHANELIMPASIAVPFRRAMQEGMGGGAGSLGSVDVTLNVTLNNASEAEAERLVEMVAEKLEERLRRKEMART